MTHEEARKKAKEIVSRMSVEEKASQLLYDSPAIERLGIHEYNWWNEGSHGVARAGTATVFPHAIALAATFNPDLMYRVGDAVSTEGRIKYNQHVKRGDFDIYKGLTFWAPNINIFRDPRWGRGQETFGEDPFLTAELGKAYIDGIQGDGEFLKASACSKHFAVHSGPERGRHSFDAKVDLHDLYETYLPAFEHTVRNGVTGVMAAYNRTNGEPCCSHSLLLGKILREEWGFDGYVTSDCGALYDIYNGHGVASDAAEAASMALKAGCDLNCGSVYHSLMDAYEQDLITEEDITRAAERVYTIRVLLGEFEERRPYADLPYNLLDGKTHRELNEQAADECVVLLKNEGNFLPLDQSYAGRIAVVGPNANSRVALEGNYHGRASEYITVSDGIRRIFPESDVRVEEGSLICRQHKNFADGFANTQSDGIAAAENADLTVLVLGLDRFVEGEEINIDNDYTVGGDRKSLGLPKTQLDLAEAVCDVCRDVIVILLCGSAMDVGEKVQSHARAILQAWYPGARGGLSVARLLAGIVSPSGKLPVTVYREDHPLPDFTDYAMTGRTYRYMEGDALYPFGYGLSYTDFAYRDARIVECDDDRITLGVKVENIGSRASIEKVQVYARFTDSRTSTPHFQLCGLAPVELSPGECRELTIPVDRWWIRAILSDGTRVPPDGSVTLFVGGHQPDPVSDRLTGNTCLKIEL